MKESFSTRLDRKIRFLQKKCPAATYAYICRVMSITPDDLDAWRSGRVIPHQLMQAGAMNRIQSIISSNKKGIDVGGTLHRRGGGKKDQYQWETVDWSMRISDIAKSLGCTRAAVYYRINRKKSTIEL